MHTTIDFKSEGRFRIATKSGSQYDLANEGGQMTLRRVPADRSPDAGYDAETLRRDNQTVTVRGFDVIEVGYPARFALEPLDPAADVTVRVTTPVTSIIQGKRPPIADTV